METEVDLIRRQDALEAIRQEIRRTAAPSRKSGLKRAREIVCNLPGERERPLPNSHWFIASCWWLCDRCGGRCTGGIPTPYCPWCGARMDELEDAEIE